MSPIRIILLCIVLSTLASSAAAADPVPAATTVAPPDLVGTGTAASDLAVQGTVGSVPLVITAPGTYTLDRDYLNLAGPIAIDVRSSNVVIDGAGHLLDGIDGPNTVGVQVHGSAALTGVTVKNLRVTDWTQGVHFWNARGRIEGVTAFSNTGSGIMLYTGGDASVITGCTSEANGIGGFSVSYSPGVAISSCTAKNNLNDGIYVFASNNVRVSGATATGNGMSGIALAGSSSARITGAVVSGCRAEGNGKAGIYMSRAQSNTVVDNRFANAQNVLLEGTEVGANTWNTPKTAGTNVIGGAWLGGNWWSGFSETAPDNDRDGLADQAHAIAAGNSDALPLVAPGSGGSPLYLGMKITVPGTYTLTQDIVQDPQDTAHPIVVEVACSNVVIEGNGHRIAGNGRSGFCGVYVDNPAGSATGVVVRNLAVSNCYYGIYMVDADGARVERCQVLDTPGGGWGLILSGGSDGNTVTGCRVLSSGPGARGLVIASSSQNAITDNEVSSPVPALIGGTVGPNTWNAPKSAGTNVVGGLHLGGNYWGAPDGTGWSQTVGDADHDGIGDAPYALAAGNTDALPLVKDRPAANFTATPSNGTAPLSVQFTDTSTGSPTSWAWTFGDGSTSTLRNPVHTYADPGTFTVSLTVRNAAGYSDTETKPGLVAVALPITLVSVSPGAGAQGSTIAVTNLAGTGFRPGATVRLARAGCTGVEAGDVVVVSPTRITCRFSAPFTSEASSAWDVVVTNPGNRSATLPNAFTFTRPSPPIVIAQPGSYLLANGTADCDRSAGIEIRSSDVVLDGAGHQVDGVDARTSVGVLVSGPVSNVTVRNLLLRDWWSGASLHRAGGSRIENSTLASNGYAGAVVYQAAAANTITGCTVTANDNGLAFLDGATAGTVSSCRIENNACGLYVYLSDGLTVTRNTIAANTETGIRYHLSASGTIYDNRLENAVNVVFTGEPFKANDWSVTPRAGPNVAGGPRIGGNYWGAPDGSGFSEVNPDGDGDGFVDYPLQIAEQNFDQYPLAPWGGPAPVVAAIPGGTGVPTDTDGDGLCDDVNGNGRKDFGDLVLYFNQMSWITGNEPVAAFDFNDNGRIDFADVVWLFSHL